MMREGSEVLYDQPVLTIDLGRHTGAILRADADLTGQYVLTGSEDKTLRVWSTKDGSCLRSIRLPAGPGGVGKVFAVALSPDGGIIAAAGLTTPATQPDNKQIIYLIDCATGRLIRSI